MRITIDIDGTTMGADAASAATVASSAAPAAAHNAAVEVFDGGPAPVSAADVSPVAPTTLAGQTIIEADTAMDAGAAPTL